MVRASVPSVGLLLAAIGVVAAVATSGVRRPASAPSQPSPARRSVRQTTPTPTPAPASSSSSAAAAAAAANRIIFPDDIEYRDASDELEAQLLQEYGPSEAIPLSLLRQLSQAEDVKDFLRFVDNATLVVGHSRSAGPFEYVVGSWENEGRASERAAGVQAKAAGCKPELQTVALVNGANPTAFYYPTCTRIERCGGCCSSDLLTCQPTKTETVLLQVVKTQYAGAGRMTYAGRELVEVEKHLACKCGCRVRATDCTPLQRYTASSCKCVCTNFDERRRCESDRTRLWDPVNCVCRCREEGLCSTGTFYDVETCSCRPWPAADNLQAEIKMYKEDYEDDVAKPNRPVTRIVFNKNSN